MGGVGSGGARPGSGPKPKSARQHAVAGDAGRRGLGRVLQHPGFGVDSAPPEVEEFDAPNELTADERKVWMLLAPFAFQNRTLVPATSLSFQLLCRNVVLERILATSEPGSASHRGLIQRVDAELQRFALSPLGKPMETGAAVPQAPANPLDKYTKGGRGA
jgi:hypothetical protein